MTTCLAVTCHMVCVLWNINLGLETMRTSHAAIYQRVFGVRNIDGGVGTMSTSVAMTP